MTRKDYVAIAKVVKSEVNHWDDKQPQVLSAITSIADGLSSVFRADNLNYDRNRFLDACGL